MRLLQSLRTFVGTAVGMVVALYLGINVFGVISAEFKRGAIEDQLTQRISDEIGPSQARAADVADVVTSEPTYTWSAQRCAVESTGTVYMADGHLEVCSLESVHAWQVEDADEAFALVADRIPAGVNVDDWGPCRSYTVSGDVFGDQVQILYIEPSAQADRFCDPTYVTYSPRRAVVGEIPVLDRTQGWLVVQDRTELVHEAIGCSRWTVLFCSNPFGDKLGWGDPPA